MAIPSLGSLMRTTNLLVVTALFGVVACTKADRSSADTAAVAANAPAIVDSAVNATPASTTSATPATSATTKTSTPTPVATPSTKAPAAIAPASATPARPAPPQPGAKPVAAPAPPPAVPAPAAAPVAVAPPAKPEVAKPEVAKPEVAKPEVAKSAVASNLTDSLGKAAYEENCRKCHGVRGVPPKTMQAKYPKIATFDAAFDATHSADSVVTILTKGKNADMTSFKDKLTHEQMVAVAAYVRSLAK